MISSKALAMSLLRVIQSPEERIEFRSSAILQQFVIDTGIGVQSGRKIIFSSGHKQRIKVWLLADNIDPNTPTSAWNHKGRSDALGIGPDEKWARGAVRSERIAFKTWKGRPLRVNGDLMYLPVFANLEWNCQQALDGFGHKEVIVVENWETFERIDDLQVDTSKVSADPLILWRGGSSTSSVGAAMRFLEIFNRPVWSAPDYDPSGLAIAARLPHLAGVLAPKDEVLKKLLAKSKLHNRYNSQLPSSEAILEGATHPDIHRLWHLVRESKNALPQEWLCQIEKERNE